MEGAGEKMMEEKQAKGREGGGEGIKVRVGQGGAGEGEGGCRKERGDEGESGIRRKRGGSEGEIW